MKTNKRTGKKPKPSVARKILFPKTPLKAFYLAMKFDVDKVEDHLLKWNKENPNKNFIPNDVVYQVYHGDLIVALRNNFISMFQSWDVKISCNVLNTTTQETHEAEMDFSLPKMLYEELLSGASNLPIERDNGEETPWEGLIDELNGYLDEQYSDEYERLTMVVVISVKTPFRSALDYQSFLHQKKVRQLLQAKHPVNQENC